MVLDPLTALSVAGTIVQFVDFSCKVLSRTFTNIQDHGFDVNGELENTTQSLFELLTKLRRPLHDNTTIGCQTEDEEKLEKVCKECQNMADDLLARLKNLKSGGKNQVWRSFRQALKTVWSETEVQKLVRRLAILKETVEMYILSWLSDKIDRISLEMSSRYEALDERTQNIIAALLDTRSTLSRQLHDQTKAISTLLSRAELVVADHDDTSRTTVIDAWRRKVASANTKQDEHHIEEKQSIHMFQEQEMQIRSKVEKYLLRSLNFSTMTTREQTIVQAHSKTFDWMFDNSPPEEQEWDSFTNWLQRGNGIYWMNGKAGSGKSTLMSYLCNDSRTQELLIPWATPLPVSIAKFFFWNSGTIEQRSQTGLLRSLLLAVLKQHRELISIILPWHWSRRYLELTDPSDDAESTLALDCWK